VGRHFSVNRMLTMDSVRLRLEREQPMSFLEFNYMLLQSFDFLELHRRHGVVLQMGGATSGATSSWAPTWCGGWRARRPSG
jgi:tyrosyl-tRNA synthetase